MTLLLAYMNWLGLDFVGNMSIVICCIAMSPFILLVIFGAWKVDTSLWFQVPAAPDAGLDQQQGPSDSGPSGGFFPNLIVNGIMLRPFFNNLYWNFNSFDSTGCFSEDVDNPAGVLPRAMFVAWIMVGLGYFIPLLVAFGTTPDVPPNKWVDGYMAVVVNETVGPWLANWMVFAAAISNIAQFQAELSSDAYLLMGMADRGHLPQFLGIRSPQGTPTYAILLGTFIIVVMSVSNLDTLIEMLNFNYALALLMEYAAFIMLRISKPDGKFNQSLKENSNSPIYVIHLLPILPSIPPFSRTPGHYWLHYRPYTNTFGCTSCAGISKLHYNHCQCFH